MGRPKRIVLVHSSYLALAEHFYQHLLQVGYTPKSSRSRYLYSCEFLHWLEQQGSLDITKVSATQIKAYYEYLSSRPSLKDGGTLSQKTTHSHLRVVRDLFALLQAEGKIVVNPCSTLNFPYPRKKRERNILTQAEIKQLYSVCQTAQERAILSLAYGCGLRVGELEKCDIKDIRLKDKLLVVPDGKGRKRRVIPLSKGVAQDLSHYFYYERDELKKGKHFRRDLTGNLYAFMLNATGSRMRQWTYNKHLKTIIERTDNAIIIKKQITIHSLRHSIATHLLEQGLTVHQVRQFLGHSQLETTQQYTRISPEQLQQILHDFN